MKKKQLFWIVPLTFIIAFLLGQFVISVGTADVLINYPVVYCIFNAEDSLNIDKNLLPITKESQREAIQQRCIKEFYNENFTYETTFQVIQ